MASTNRQLDKIKEETLSKTNESWFIAQKDVPLSGDFQAQQRHFLGYVLENLTNSGFRFDVNTVTSNDTTEPMKPHFDKTTMIPNLVASYAKEYKVQGMLNQLSIIPSASEKTDIVRKFKNGQKIGNEKGSDNTVEQKNGEMEKNLKKIEEQSRTENIEKVSRKIEEQSRIQVSNWHDTTPGGEQSVMQSQQQYSGGRKSYMSLKGAAPDLRGHAQSTFPNNHNSIVDSTRGNLDVPINLDGTVHETTSSRRKNSPSNDSLQFGFGDLPATKRKSPKHLKKKKKKIPLESDFSKRLRQTKESMRSSLQKNSSDMQIVRYDSPKNDYRARLKNANEIIAKMKSYSNRINQIMREPVQQINEVLETEDDQKYTLSEKNEPEETPITPNNPPFNSKSEFDEKVSEMTNEPQNMDLLPQSDKKYVIFSDAGSVIESIKTKYGKFHNPTSNNQKLMPGFRTVKNYAIQPPNVDFQKKGPRPVKKRAKTRRGILSQNLTDLGLDPLETVSYLTASGFLIKLIEDNRDLLQWHLSPSKNLNLLDLQIFSYHDNLIKSDKIYEPQVFQNQFEKLNIDKIKSQKLGNLSMISKLTNNHLKIEGHHVILKQLVFIKSLTPIKAFTLRYKFFHFDTQFLTENDLIQKYNKLNITPLFNLKISESIQDVLQQIPGENSPLSFQTFTFSFGINLKSGRPDLIEINPSCFEKPSENYPKSYQDCILSLLMKIDKQVRQFNGLNPNLKYNPTIFRTFWQKVVDSDMTEVDVRYDAPLKVSQREFRAINISRAHNKAKETDEETQRDYNGFMEEEIRKKQKEMSVRSYRIPHKKQEQQAQSVTSSYRNSFIISNKDYSIVFSDDIYPDDKIVKIQAFFRMVSSRTKFVKFLKAIKIIQQKFRKHFTPINDIAHNIKLMKMFKLLKSFSPLQNLYSKSIQYGFHQIQIVTHFLEIEPDEDQEIIIVQKPIKKQILIPNEINYEPSYDVQSVTEKNVKLKYGVGQNEESKLSNYTRIVGENSVISQNQQISYQEQSSVPSQLSVDKMTKNAILRTNILKNDPYFEYMEQKRLKQEEILINHSVQSHYERIPIISTKPGSPSRSQMINIQNLSVSSKRKSEKLSQKEENGQDSSLKEEINQNLIETKSSKKQTDQNEAKSSKSISIQNLSQAKSSQKQILSEDKSKQSEKQTNQTQGVSKKDTNYNLSDNKSEKSVLNPSIQQQPKLNKSLTKINETQSNLNQSAHKSPQKTQGMVLVTEVNAPDKVGANSIQASPNKRNESALASIIIPGSIMLDETSSMAVMTDKGIQYEELPQDKGVQYSIPAQSERAPGSIAPTSKAPRSIAQSSQAPRSFAPPSRKEEPIISAPSDDHHLLVKDSSNKLLDNIEITQPGNLVPTQSVVTLASHLRNADDIGDEHPIADHGQIGFEGLSMRNEQSDNPIENFHKIKPKSKKPNPKKIPSNDSEGVKDSQQPFKNFGTSKIIGPFLRGKHTTSQIREHSISEEQSQGLSSQQSEVVNKHLQNIVGYVKLKPQYQSIDYSNYRNELNKSINQYTINQNNLEVQQNRSMNRSVEISEQPNYELPKKKKHNMSDPEHVMGCQSCLRKQQLRLEQQQQSNSQPKRPGPPMNSVRQRYKKNMLGKSLDFTKKEKKNDKRLYLPDITKKNDEAAFIQNFIQKGQKDIKRQIFLEKKLKQQAQEIEKIRQMQEELMKLSEQSPSPQRFPNIRDNSPRMNPYFSPEILSPNSSSPGHYQNPFGVGNLYK